MLRAGCAAAALVMLGSAAVAPFSVGTAFADFRIPTDAAIDGPQELRLGTGAMPPPLDLTVSLAADESAEPTSKASTALYSLSQFMSKGVVNWGGYRFTYYSQQVLPGGGLQIPGRHVTDAGYVADADGFIVLAGSAPKGTVYETPFGASGKIYDRGTVGNHLDVYIR